MADYLQECMESIDSDIDASIEEFEEIFCDRCMNHECERSDPTSWIDRMQHQEEITYNPNYGDPSRFEGAHNQDFISYDEDDFDEGSSYDMGGWTSWEDEDVNVHREDPPEDVKPSDKVDRHVQSLEGEEGEDEFESEADEPYDEDDDGSVEDADQGHDPSDDSDRSGQEQNPDDLPDQSGKVIGDHDPSQFESDMMQSRSGDDWTVDDESDGSVTVNIGTGEKVDE